MPRYGENLLEILIGKDKCLSDASIFYLGLSLLNILEVIHNSGIIYNNMKPENILIGLD